MSYQANNQQLPVRYDQVDQRTFNPSLPHNNEVTPPVNPPPGLDSQVMNQVAAMFRLRCQNSSQKTPLHTFAYNLLSHNFFQNERYTHWVQYTMDFTAFLMQARGYQPQQAVEKAVDLIYTGMLAMIAAEYPAIVSQIDQGIHHELMGAAQALETIKKDLNTFQQQRSHGGMPPQQGGYPQQMPGYQQQAPSPTMTYGQSSQHQLPPVNVSSGYPQQGGGVGNTAPAPYQLGGSAPSGYTPPPQTGGVTSGAPAGGRFADAPAQSSQPMAQTPADSWTAGQPVNRNMANIQPPNLGGGSKVPPPQPETPPMMPNQPAPHSVDEIDLIAHAAANYSERPYDEIHIPGGVVARPAHLSGWKRTRSDAKPYAIAYDPKKYILFHVKWPDGVVEEKLVEYQPMKNMDYLQHEINARLRGEKIKPEGKVIPTHHKVIDFDEPLKPVEEVKESLDKGLIDKDALRPVILEGLLTASSDLENEETALQQVAEQLGLSSEELTHVPAHEYTSANMYPFNLPDEGQERLKMLATTDSLQGLATGLVEAVNDGLMSQRYFRFFDERLTRMINAALADNMGLDQLKIDSFVEDIEGLFPYLANHHGPELVEVLMSRTKGLLMQWMSLRYEETEDGSEDTTLFLADEYVNLQLPWTSDEMASLNLTDEPVLLQSSTHPKITRVVNEMLKRHDRNGTLLGRFFRLITADGIYLTVLRGWLVEQSVLLKRVN